MESIIVFTIQILMIFDIRFDDVFFHNDDVFCENTKQKSDEILHVVRFKRVSKRNEFIL